MSIDDFWHKDKRLYVAYEKGYYARQYETAWLNGLYVDVAINALANNIFAKKGAKKSTYPEKPIDVFEKKVILTDDEKEKQFRESIYKVDWLKQGIKKER